MAAGSKNFDGMSFEGGMTCEDHPGRSLDILCRDHDVVLCSVCASETHIACIGLEPITNDSIIKTTKKDFKQFGKDVSQMKTKITKLKTKREEDKKKLKEETEKAVKDVGDFRNLIDWVLDRMERKGKEYIEKRHQELNKVIDDDISQCEEMLALLRKTKQQWKNGKDHHASAEQYVNINKGKQALKKSQKLCDAMKTHTHRDIVKFTVDSKVENFARNLSWFGKDRTYLSFEQPLCFPHLYEVKQNNQFDIRVRGDKHVCWVTDMCQLEDGTILAVDAANHRVKQLDVLYQVVDTCDIDVEPKAVASLNEDQAVVAIDRGIETEIQFIELKNGLPFGDCFKVPGQCSGLTCSPEAIYVSVGNKICKYSISGELVEEIDTGYPVARIQLTSDNEKLVFLDSKGRLAVLDKYLEVSKEVTIENCTTDCDLAVDQNGQIMISMFESHGIVQYNHDLQKLGAVVGPSSGIKNPQTIAFDRINNRLVVGMKFKNVIKAFGLK